MHCRKIADEYVKLKEKAEEGGWTKFFQGARNAADLKDKNDRIKQAFEAFDVGIILCDLLYSCLNLLYSVFF